MAPRILSVTLQHGANATRRDVSIEHAVIAGWTGRDPAAVEKHIKELEELGVKRPASTPIFYRVSASRLTTDSEIEATGATSGGEVEFVLLQTEGKMWVGLGSDHTDREVETYGVTVSKQMCDKPLATQFWAYDEVAPHWDDLLLRSFVVEGGERKVYQDGSIKAMMDPIVLIKKRMDGKDRLPENTLMYCGTLAAKGGVRPTDNFEYEIEDPVLKRKIAHSYKVAILPVLG